MGTTAEKLNKVLETKEAIKQALINKGVQVSDTDSFASYIGKIEQISGGGSSSSLPTPISICGLSFWIDGQCNTRNGKDHSKKYMENLVWNKPYSTSTSNREVFPSASSNNVWKDDILKLATYAFYPACFSSSLTLEMVFLVDDDFDENLIVNPFRQDLNNKGFFAQCSMLDDDLIVRMNVNSGVGTVNMPIEKNTKCYVTYTISGKNLKVFANGQTQEVTMSNSYSPPTSDSTYAGVGLGSNGADSSRWKGLNIGMVRMWSRVLSDEEIQANYTDAKTRFGF